jgi:DNA-binding MarR family transcriptional regulator
MRNIHKEGSLRLAAIELGKCLLDIGRRRTLRDPLASSMEMEAEFTPPQLHSLTWLGFDGPLTMGELARRCAITEKTITGVVDRMERLNLFHRERDLEDRRMVRVRLTKQGEATFAKLRENVVAKLAGLLQLLDPEDRKGLQRIFENLRDRMDVGVEHGRREQRRSVDEEMEES